MDQDWQRHPSLGERGNQLGCWMNLLHDLTNIVSCWKHWANCFFIKTVYPFSNGLMLLMAINLVKHELTICWTDCIPWCYCLQWTLAEILDLVRLWISFIKLFAHARSVKKRGHLLVLIDIFDNDIIREWSLQYKHIKLKAGHQSMKFCTAVYDIAIRLICIGFWWGRYDIRPIHLIRLKIIFGHFFLPFFMVYKIKIKKLNLL